MTLRRYSTIFAESVYRMRATAAIGDVALFDVQGSRPDA
jgi:hypothetical protein